ncbi:hypothetical protein SAMN05444274_104372 [Mariniphaga anaerophila]|uniref:Universal stress protein family protein n=1 Tax=Mariniphaga anaerophila TaxID=1484053 RepID=A0A1M5AKY4_9BACT|nr:hypothetical protein [Mariniphaga anaerophila]SHF30794.1 hypothetical protein SAMN05444274_104372 [Mariniphaga anaerophila]
MDEKKEQKIIVFTTLSEKDKNLILNGVKLASVFKKELCLVYRLNKKEAKKSEMAKKKLNEYLVPLNREIPGLKTSLLLLTEPLKYVPDTLADEHEAILFVADSGLFKTYSKAVTESPVPFIFVYPEAPLSSFKNIVLPVDIRKENSDSSLWCSWFGRFNRSEIIAIAANDRLKESKKQIGKNILLTKKLFLKFNINHKIFKGQKSSLQNSFEALDFALSNNADMLVILGSSVITPLDWLLGLPEKKIIKKAGSLPVLLVNPRRDNYILCD